MTDAPHNLRLIIHTYLETIFNTEKYLIMDMVKLSIRRRLFNISRRSRQCQNSTFKFTDTKNFENSLCFVVSK